MNYTSYYPQVTESCGCGASIILVVSDLQVRELLQDWRTNHHHDRSQANAE